MTRTFVKGLLRCGAVTGLLLGATATSEATSLTLANGDSSVQLCVPEHPSSNSCASTGLFNWVVNGGVDPFQQWFSFGVAPDASPAPPAWTGTIDQISDPVVTHPTSSTASVAYQNWSLSALGALAPIGIALQVNYALFGSSGSAAAHIAETITLVNPTYYYLYVALTDGLGINESHFYVEPHTSLLLATADYTANPEPMSMILLGTGLLAVARARRRMTAIA